MKNWARFLSLLEKEAGRSARDRIEARACQELGGVRFGIPQRKRTTRADIDKTLAACGFNVERAALRLGINKSTLYRRLSRTQAAPRNRIIR